MRMPYRLRSWQLAAAILLWIPLGATLAETPRTVIHIFKYARVADTDVLAQQRFDEFKEILQAKILRLAEELSGQEEPLQYLSGLRPHFVSKDGQPVTFEGSSDQLLQRWHQSNALQIFLGRLRNRNGQFSARSKVFLGKLPSDLPQMSLQVDLPIIDEEFDTTRDSHSAIILYGLAMDARSRCSPESEVITLLSNASELLSSVPADIKGRQELEEAIQKGLERQSACTGGS